MPETKAKTNESYVQAVGRRKTATARVRLVHATKTTYAVNDKELATYFPTRELQSIVSAPFDKGGISEKFKVTVKVAGGGIHSQAEAVRLGVARAIVKLDPELRKKVKKEGFLARDQRAKERRKFGLKKARKAPQWSKR